MEEPQSEAGNALPGVPSHEGSTGRSSTGTAVTLVAEPADVKVSAAVPIRYTRVSFLVENNTPVEVIKAWIGHGSERMVRRYTHLRPQYRSRVLASIPCVFGSKIDVIDPLTQQAVA